MFFFYLNKYYKYHIMINTILLSLFATSFLAEIFYFYVYYNVPTEPLLNFNSGIRQPLNLNQDITDYNTNITEYIMSQPPHVCL